MHNQTILIAFGGVSPEHEVSVLTAMQAFSALEASPFRLVPLYISKSGSWHTGDYLLKLNHYQDLDKIEANGLPCTFARNEIGQPVLQELKHSFFQKPAVHPLHAVLTAFHGGAGENGSFQGACELFNLPYTGCEVLASSIGMDKVTTKSICRANGIPVVDDVHFPEEEWLSRRKELLSEIEKLSWPVIVKPVHLGSSIGVTMARSRDELTGAIELGFRYDEQILVEKAVTPLMEINCSVLGTPGSYRVSVCERPLSEKEHLSFEDKYQREAGSGKGMASADRVIPADISDELTAAIQKTTKKVFEICRGSGLARLDFLVNRDTNQFYFNEINTIPGSFSYYLWKESGLNFKNLLEELIEIALKRHRQKSGRVQSYETNLLSQKAALGMKGLKGLKGPRQGGE
ncbi:MAG: D-alanine--D-alanine ligase family protein [Balneolaceae bacterium]